MCGTQGTLAPPVRPPASAFRLLGALLLEMDEGRPYSLLQVR